MKKAVVAAAAVTTAAVVVAAVAVVREWSRRRQQWKQTQRILRNFARDCATPVPLLWHVASDLVSHMQAALASSGHTNLTFLVSYLASLPTGDEKGVYYGVNLRGTNFTMLRARLAGNSEAISELQREEVSIPSDVMAAPSKELFSYISLELSKFASMNEENTKDRDARQRRVGFTVLYPVEEAAVSSGTAIKWQRFSVDDTIGEELVNDMNQALEKHGVDMRVSALVDDSIGDLAGGRYYNKESVAAITLGMGTNAAYVESAQEVHKWRGPSPESGEMVINMQWGNFNSSHFPVTEFDASLDAESSNPGSQTFEKLVSGMYLGEIVRRVLLKMAQETALFGDSVPPKLRIPYLLRSPDMAAMHQDASEDHDVVDDKLKEVFEITDSTPTVRQMVSEVCDIVAERGARLAGAGIVGIIKKLGRIEHKKSVVTVEGGLYEHYRVFRNYLHSSVWEMLGNEFSDHVTIEPSHGGSGAGALFLAASQTQMADLTLPALLTKNADSSLAASEMQNFDSQTQNADSSLAASEMQNSDAPKQNADSSLAASETQNSDAPKQNADSSLAASETQNSDAPKQNADSSLAASETQNADSSLAASQMQNLDSDSFLEVSQTEDIAS